MNHGMTYTGLRYIATGGDEEIPIGEGLSLVKPNETLLDHGGEWAMSRLELREEAKASRFLVCWHPRPRIDAVPLKAEDTGENRFYSGLMAIQVIKPVETFGFIHKGTAMERRPPMHAGSWARLKRFDEDMLGQIPAMVKRIQGAMNDESVERRNALILLQLGLEHFHPYIAGLLWVMGLEAIFDSGNRNDFKAKLCACLGPKSTAFPDWNTRIEAPHYTVEEIAIPLYLLRNKLAHGADLRSAATDKSTPVNLIAPVRLTAQSQQKPYADLLSQAACYLLCQVLQRVL